MVRGDYNYRNRNGQIFTVYDVNLIEQDGVLTFRNEYNKVVLIVPAGQWDSVWDASLGMLY
jgi:hypothetical protein